MTKAPAFQFYPTDFVGSGTVGRATIDEVGIYTLLLCLDWTDGGFEFDVPRLSRWCRTTERKLLATWKYLQPCFTERDGKYYNKRLEEERQKQAQRRAQLSENGKKGGRPKKAKGLPKETKSFPETKANDNQNESLLSSSLSSSSVTTKHPRASAPWMGLVRDVWHEVYPDAEPLSGTAKTLAPLFSKHPEGEVCEWLRQTLRDTDPKYLNLAKAASTYSGPQPRYINGDDEAAVRKVLGMPA
jgi:uncharacterized protein YdaU (DUF1376 family)